MDLCSRIAQYHSQSRATFILFTEMIAFAGSLATMLGIGFLRELFS
jgi:hypothetical protein